MQLNVQALAEHHASITQAGGLVNSNTLKSKFF